jgi:hypothetical protein
MVVMITAVIRLVAAAVAVAILAASMIAVPD